MKRIGHGILMVMLVSPCFAQAAKQGQQEKQQKQQKFETQSGSARVELPRMIVIRTKSVGQGAEMQDEDATLIELMGARTIVSDDESAQDVAESTQEMQGTLLREGSQEGAPEEVSAQFKACDSTANALIGEEKNAARFHHAGRFGGHGGWFVGTGTRGHYGYSSYRSYRYPSYGYWSGSSYYPYTYSYSYPYGGYQYYYYYNPYYGW